MSGGLGSSLLALALVLSNSLVVVVVVVADRTDNALGVDSTAVESVGGDTARVQKQAALLWVVVGNPPAPLVAPLVAAFAVALVPKAASRVRAHRGFARGETPRQSP